MIKIHLEYLHWAKSLQSKTESKKLIFLYSLESHKKITNFILKFDRSLGYCNCGLHSIKHPVLYDSTLFKFSKFHQLFKCSQHNLIFMSSSASHRVFTVTVGGAAHTLVTHTHPLVPSGGASVCALDTLEKCNSSPVGYTYFMCSPSPPVCGNKWMKNVSTIPQHEKKRSKLGEFGFGGGIRLHSTYIPASVIIARHRRQWKAPSSGSSAVRRVETR